MKRLLLLVFASLLFEGCYHGPDDKYYHLTQEQLDFINTPKAGDTCIWESSLGYRDTATIKSVVIEKYTIQSHRDGTEFGERGYYLYRFLRNTGNPIYIGIYIWKGINIPVRSNSLCIVDTSSHMFKTTGNNGEYLNKYIGSTLYERVYFTYFKNDSVFWNNTGLLCVKNNKETMTRIK